MSRILIAACAIAGAAFILTPQARADASDPAGDLAHAWDHVQFELTDRDQRLQGFSDLADRADHMLQTSPDNAEVMVWEAISLSSEAGEIRGPSALGKVKKARDLLLAAEQIDPNTLGDGSIYSSPAPFTIRYRRSPSALATRRRRASSSKRHLSRIRTASIRTISWPTTWCTRVTTSPR